MLRTSANLESAAWCCTSRIHPLRQCSRMHCVHTSQPIPGWTPRPARLVPSNVEVCVRALASSTYAVCRGSRLMKTSECDDGADQKARAAAHVDKYPLAVYTRSAPATSLPGCARQCYRRMREQDERRECRGTEGTQNVNRQPLLRSSPLNTKRTHQAPISLTPRTPLRALQSSRTAGSALPLTGACAPSQATEWCGDIHAYVRRSAVFLEAAFCDVS